MARKKERQFVIKQIIQEEDIANQEILLHRLHQRGFKTTQATLSRDLHNMGIVRVPTAGGYRYAISEEEGGHSFRKLIGMEILGVYGNESLVTVKTITGRAKGVALFIDQMKHKHILGTVAGENAIIVIPDSVKNISGIRDDLERISYE
ncbi:MAG: arginine repressor [Calditrichaeota bacterium]|nr:arginine repressor [Calditrichota bacterium]RQW06809.1 MAG: arginine repressor [Calditrichota bacterium]